MCVIRSELGRLSKLSVGFALYSNAFTSSIPSELGAMTGMTAGYYLCMNSFTNSLPSELGRMSLMTNQFRLDTNQVSCILSHTRADPRISHTCFLSLLSSLSVLCISAVELPPE